MCRLLPFPQSAEILCRDGASYPEHVELATKGHALEAVEVGVCGVEGGGSVWSGGWWECVGWRVVEGVYGVEVVGVCGVEGGGGSVWGGGGGSVWGGGR